MRIGLNSLIGDGFGSGSLSFGEVSGTPPSYPPYGTFHQTLTGQEYPIAEGGASFYFTEGSYNVPSQICDVDQMHDGAGGYFIDWSTVTNITYKAVGTLFAQGSQYYSDPVDIPTGNNTYFDSALSHNDYKHNGIGGYSLTVVLEYYLTGEVDPQLRDETGFLVEVPTGSGTFYGNGKYDTYNWDGNGGYTLATNQGSYYSNGTGISSIDIQVEVPTGSGMTFSTGKVEDFFWNGSGGYTTALSGSYYSNGTYIYNDGTNDYYWDGNGGYYI